MLWLVTSKDTNNNKVCLQETPPSEYSDTDIIRSSPIYSIGCVSQRNPFPEKKGHILFIFTPDTYFALGSIKNNLADFPDGLLERVFISHGCASIIVFFSEGQKSDIDKLVGIIKENIFAHEVWDLNDDNSFITTTRYENCVLQPDFVFKFSDLNQEDQFVFQDLVSSLRLAYSQALVPCDINF